MVHGGEHVLQAVSELVKQRLHLVKNNITTGSERLAALCEQHYQPGTQWFKRGYRGAHQRCLDCEGYIAHYHATPTDQTHVFSTHHTSTDNSVLVHSKCTTPHNYEPL
jgi:hypothetical protein